MATSIMEWTSSCLRFSKKIITGCDAVLAYNGSIPSVSHASLEQVLRLEPERS